MRAGEATQDGALTKKKTIVGRLVGYVVAMSALAVILSGCVAIKSETASQRAPGAVTLTLEICVNDENGTRYQTCKPANRAATAALGYTAEGDNGSDYVTDPATTAFGQMLVGFRVPDGTGAPASFQDEKGRLTFNSSPGYAAALTTEYVPIAGFKWVGYLSSGFSFDGTSADNFTFKLNPEFVLPQAPNGGPFPGPFRWRAVIGSRFIDNAGGLPADRPIECPLGNVGCFDSPPIGSATDPNPVRQTLPHLATPLTVSDYSVRPPDATSTAPGETATLTYRLSNQDARNFGAPTLTLKATTAIPGAQPQLGPTTIAIPRNGETTAAVTVPIPPGTPVGTYDVVLTTTGNSVPAGADIKKSATAKLTVVDKTAPTVRVSSPADTTYTLGQSVAADYGCTDETGGSGVASCSGPVPSGAAIDTSTPGTFSFTVTGTDNAGNAASATKSYTVAARPPVVVATVPVGRVNVTLSFLFPSAAASTKFTLLQVKGVPAGSTVVATCKGKGCPTKKVKSKKQNVVFTKKNASGTVNLTPFRNKALRAGAVLTVTVTKPGSFGMVKKLTVKKNKKPVLSTTCLQPNSSTAKASCVS